MTEVTTPLPRITGTEMEWGGMVVPLADKSPNLRQIEDQELFPHVDYYLKAADIPYIGTNINAFLSNGARFYKDLGELREYSTPEDTSFLGTVANEIVNDRIMRGIALRFEDQTDRPISFTKRVVDDNKVTRGYHASYTVDAQKLPINAESLKLFGVFAATRATLFGSGALTPHGSFVIAQKTLNVTTDFNEATVNNKPVVNLRNEPHADKQRFLRFHDTSGDPTMSPWATRTKLGAASLVLRMIENGVSVDSLRFQGAIAGVAKGVAYDTSLCKVYKLTNGDSITALDVQERLAQYARKMANSETVSLDTEEMWALDEWERAISDMKQEPRLTIDRVDWVMRREILKRQKERHGWAWNSQQLRYKDRQFSDVAIDGIAVALRETVWADHMPPEELIKKRMRQAPETTRASVRGKFVRGIGKLTVHAGVGWSSVSYNGKNVALPDPYQMSSRKVSELLRSIHTGGEK